MEIKEEIVQRVPEQLKSTVQRRTRQSVDNDNRTFGWYQTEKTDSNTDSKTETTEEKPFYRDPVAELKEKLAEYEKSETSSRFENARLQKELEELQRKFNSDEEALKAHEKEDSRLKNLINIEQRKCYDLQREAVQLRVQIARREQADKEAAESSAAEKPAEKSVDRPKIGAKKSKKSQSTKSVEKPAEKSQAELEKEDPLNHPHGWHSTPQTHFTEMVAKAQQEELEHGKTFAETLKESLKPAPVSAPTSGEFLVVGGDNSMHHVTLPLAAK